MKGLFWLTAISLAMLSMEGPCMAEEPERLLSHDVYFSLKAPSQATTTELVAACKKYLAGHPGTIWFAVGPIAGEFRREVNDLGFDVALHVVFKNKAAHDQYQTSERHLEFISKNKDLWKSVRVFDSYVAASSHADM